MKRSLFRISGVFFLVALLALAHSCKETDQAYQTKNAITSKPIGEIDNVMVITDRQLWRSPVKDTFLYYFQAPYILLPQPEPIFRIKHFNWQDLKAKPIRKNFRTILFLTDVSDTDSPVTKEAFKDLGEERIQKLLEASDANFAVAKNKWVKGQMIIYLLGNGEDDLNKKIVKNFPAIADQIRQHDASLIHRRVYFSGHNKAAGQMIRDSFGIDIDIPASYVVSAVKNHEVIWLRRETENLSSSIIVARVPYLSKSQFSRDSLKAIVNRIGKKYIASEIEGSYFRINDEDLPIFYSETNLNGLPAGVLRGIWELENDYMGGPFIAYLLPNPKKPDELVLLLGFVYAPEKEKKSYMEDLEEILRTAKK